MTEVEKLRRKISAMQLDFVEFPPETDTDRKIHELKLQSYQLRLECLEWRSSINTSFLLTSMVRRGEEKKLVTVNDWEEFARRILSALDAKEQKGLQAINEKLKKAYE